jgi:DNA polymerase-3 subunit delta
MFYIFHGPDDFSAKETLEKLKTRLGDPAMVDLNTTELDGKNLALPELIHHVRAMPFLAPKRVVVVQNYLKQFNTTAKTKAEKDLLAQLTHLLEDVPETTNLVFMETEVLKKRNPILQMGLLHDKAVHEFSAPQNLVGWVQRRVKQKGGDIDRQAAFALATAVGDDLRTLDNEIEKLTLYVNQARPISVADVTLLCPYTADTEAFALANAIGRRDIKTALDELHKKLQEGDHPLALLASITTQFRGLLEIKSLSDEGYTPQQIANYKGWKSDFAVKKRLQEGKNFSQARLLDIFNILLEADLGVKTGKIEQTMMLDILVTRLCGVRD